MEFPKSRNENLARQTADDETMSDDLLTDKAFFLNETSVFVWRMCNGETDLITISPALAEKNNQPINEDIVKLAIDKLREAGLMSEETPKFFSKASRRRIIKNHGKYLRILA